MDLLDRFMQGLELRDPTRSDPRPLDFAVSNDTGTLLTLANWWTTSWGMGTGILFVPAVLDQHSLRFVGLEDEGFIVAGPTDQFFADFLANARLRTDLDRGRYYRELQKLVEFEPDFDFTAWTSAVLERPTVDPVAALRAQYGGLREIGTLRLLDHTGATVDVLAVDAYGQVATFLDDGWLTLFASQWSGYADEARPDIASFLGWLAQQSPYGPFALDEPKLTAAEGDLDAFVRNALSATPTT